MLIGVLIGMIGIACLIFRQTMLGVIIGLQLTILGTTATFVLSGAGVGVESEGILFALFVLMGGICQIVIAYALATRLFYLKRNVEMKSITSLRH